MNLKKVFTLIVCLLWCAFCMGQQKAYKSYVIGDTVDNVPDFQNVVNYPKKTFSLKELRGKLVIIDFWATWCTACIRLMPHMEALQKEFGDKIQVILVDPWETKAEIDKRMTYMKAYKTPQALSSLPNVIGDTIWRKIFVHSGVPHHVWIDGTGKVVATTTGENATPEHIRQVLSGQKTNMVVKRDLEALGYDVKKKGLIPMADSSMHPLFYSVLLRKNPGFGSGALRYIDSAQGLYKYTARNLPIKFLFTDAYADMKPALRMLVEARDTDAFVRPKDKNRLDSWAVKNEFNYEIVLPLSLKDSIHAYMRADLNRYLASEKGITGSIEMRKMRAYVLRRINDFVLQPKGLPKDTNAYYNYDIRYVEVSGWGWLSQWEDVTKSRVFIDETGIANDQHVFIALPKQTKSKEEYILALKKQGLILQEEERTVPVLIIKDI